MKDLIETHYLNKAHVLELYSKLFMDDNTHLCQRPDLLDDILEVVKDDVKYPAFEDKVTYLLCGILQNHLFTDGNKKMSVLVGALFLVANGYKEYCDRFISEMFRNMPSLARGLMGRELVRDIIHSILNGEQLYPEQLQMRILFAIDESFEDKQNAAYNLNNWFWFEKQVKKTERADNINSVDFSCQKYPCVKLVLNDNWNDFGYKTWFSLWYITNNNTATYIGDLKITDREGKPFSKMSDGFEALSDNFCSLGVDSSYYQQLLNVFGRQEARRLLKALRDSAIDNIIFEEFSRESAYINSLLRDISSEKARREARFILENRKKSEAYSFKYHFSPIYNREYVATWDVPIDYDAVPYKLTYSVIGENAVGKTQLLSNVMRDLASEQTPNFEKVPLLSSVLVICSSTFDSYNELQPDRKRIPLNVCSVVQDDKTIYRLDSAIKTIIDRGTIYRDGNVLTIRKKYCQLLDILLEKKLSDRLFNKRHDGDEEKYELDSEELGLYIERMSTGQLQIFSLVTYVCAYIHLNSIVIVDEPEVHLHPRMITEFFCVLNGLLYEFQSYAIVATHSPLVVRECVDRNVYLMTRNQFDEPVIKAVPFKTFGEDITNLYESVFGYKDSKSHFYRIIRGMVEDSSYSFDSIVGALRGQGVHLSMNTINTISICMRNEGSRS